MKEHKYRISLQWTGNNGRGTANYRAYNRSYEIKVPGKPIIFGSSDPTFRGDKTKYNPEELLIASLSSCHMLWYLHLCADAGIIVTKYCDRLMGCVVLVPLDEISQKAQLIQMAVEESMQGRGIETLLVQELLKFAKA